MLVQLFSSVFEKEKIVSITTLIQNTLPDAVIIGTTTAGEIDNERIREGGILLSFSAFETSSLRTFESYGESSYQLGKEMARTLLTPETGCIIAFVDGLAHNGEEFLKGFSSANIDKVPIAGGMSADGMHYRNTFTVLGTHVASNGVVAVAIDGERLRVSQEYNLSWKPIGRVMEVTRSDGNKVYEINNIPVIDVYRDFLGQEVVANLPLSAIEFPLILEEEGIQIARSMIGVGEEGGMIVFAGDLPMGAKVRFGIGSIKALAQCRQKTYEHFSKYSPEAVFIYSCSSRKAFLGDTLQKEFIPLTQLAGVSGFFTYGEFYPFSDNAKFLNNSTTVLGLSEHENPIEYKDTDCLKNENHSLSGDALLHLVNRVMEDLEKYETKNESIRTMLDELNRSIDSVLIISKTDLEGNITYVNNHFCTISGYTEEELIGNSHKLIRHQETSDEVYESLWKTIESGRVWEGELKYRSKRGDDYYVKSFILPMKDAEGVIVEYLGIFENITDLIQAQHHLMQEKVFNQMVMETDQNIILIMENGILKKLNKSFFDDYPYTNQEEFSAAHSCICELFLVKEGYLSASTDTSKWYDPVILHPHRIHKALMRDTWGNERIYSVKARELLFEGNVYVAATLNDITEIENAKTEAENAKNSRTEFLAAMSHEIRTPMNGIIGFVELLESTPLDYKQKKYVEIIQNSTKSLLGIINNILDFAKIEKGQSDIDLSSVNLHLELYNHFKLFEANATDRSITYRLQTDPAIAECLQIDILRLKQVLGNLIGNAIKFTPSAGTVTISASLNKSTARSQSIRFSIKDSGIGISKEKHQKIFEPFAQADGSTTREFGGTGLGLSISSKILAMMGSALLIQSEPGKGSDFYFDIDFSICKENRALSSVIAREMIGVEKSASPYFTRIIDTLDLFNVAYEIEEWGMFSISVHPIVIVFNTDTVRRMQKAGYKGTMIAVGVEGITPSESCLVFEAEQCCTSGKCSYIYTALSEILGVKQALNYTEDAKNVGKSFLRVLVAEDQEVNRILIEELLKRFGIFPDVVVDGREAVDKVLGNSYDLVFMDINMPSMNGIEATRHIRKAGLEIPIVALTANAMEGDREKLLSEGLSDYLSKPILFEKLEAIIMRYDAEIPISSTEPERDETVSFVQKLENELELDRTIIEKLLKVYFTSVEHEMQMLYSAIMEMDRDQTRDIAHKIVGSSANLRLECAASLAKEIEGTSQRENRSELENVYTKLKTCIQTLREKANYEQ